MAPTKRARPSFSPPRPGKSKPKSATAAKTTKSNGVSKSRAQHKGRKGTRAALLGDEDEDETEAEEADSDVHPGLPRGRSSLIEDDASEDEDEEEDGDLTATSGTKRHRPSNASSSPEPDMILAEITHNSSSDSSQTPIPIPLIHKILQRHFAEQDKTRISKDARELLAKYLEVFVKEAIARCVFERREVEGDRDGGGGPRGVAGGFLEVEDLERAAVQLCLDF